MKLLIILVIAIFCLGANAASIKQKPFANLKKYSVAGIISLPYAEIEEPFRAWYDEDQFASRIDYYDGMEVTIQQAPRSSKEFGVGIKISPMTDEEQTNVKTCFWINGTEENPLSIQNIIPDFTDFTLVGVTKWKEYTADEWQSIVQEGDKKNTYKFLINSRTGEPLYYEMDGYDSLLGSHYDKYYIEYFNFKSGEDIPASVFEITESLHCGSFPGPGNRASMNPMREFIHRDDSHIYDKFDDFKNTHSKEYNSDLEHRARLEIFRSNVRFIESYNRKGLTYKLAINHLADKSDEELKLLRGKQKTVSKNNGLPFDAKKYGQTALPDSFDWRIFGAVTPVKDQGICGSCWSFGTTGAIEGAYFVKYNKLVRFSPQNLVDCSWGFGNNGCDGGEDFRAYDWIIKHGGIATEETYGQYLMSNGFCHFDKSKAGAVLNGYVNITEYDPVALKTALLNEGPISVAIDAGHKSMVFYSHGLYFEPDCGNKPDNLDHAVLLVGYGKIYGQDYWLIKNSWSTYWGNDGYVLMSQKDNNCGVTTQTTYPIIA